MQMPALTNRKARGQTRWPGSQLCLWGPTVSWVASSAGASAEVQALRDAQ